ncbi:DUF2336 domain-containing protein [Thalassobaculum sp.]|uniref:DUF2336 domain-containing protein n=1 Tax=Thalassobaculum sp. TaxID=2022740 RepID=UPI0032EEFFB8
MSGPKPSDPKSGGLPTAELAARLAKGATPDARAEVAATVGKALEAGTLGAGEMQLATDIVRRLAIDVERQVRESLAAAVRRTSDLPHDVAIALARDIASVARPVLEESSVLTDSDLVELISADDEDKQLAVATRPTLSEAVADALVAHGTENVVVAVVSNPGAVLAEPTLDLALDRFPDSERVHAPLVARDALPVAVAERLVAMVSDRLQGELVRRHSLPLDLATDLILDGRERATLGLVNDSSPPERVEDLVRSLANGGRLTSSIVVRAACIGDVTFVETALAVLAKVPVDNAGRLVHDSGRRGLEALADKAGIGPRDRVVLRAAVETVDETELGDGPTDRQRFAETVIERVLTRFDTDEMGVSDEDVMYLIKKLEGYVAARPDAASL